jgi:tetratricopeptide (TPR) repeat protein
MLSAPFRSEKHTTDEVRPSRSRWALPAALLLAAGLMLVAVTTTGGFDGSITIAPANTWAEIALTLAGAGAGVTMLVAGGTAPRWGAAAVGLFALLELLTALSITWSVAPEASWQAADLTLGYLMTFAGSAALARLLPGRWTVLLQALAMFTVALCGYALLTKVFPSSLAADDTQGRLQAPLGYWNALGGLAVLGLGPVLWLYTRPGVSFVVRGLAVPGAALLGSAVILSYSRTALVAAVLVIAAWLVFVPVRLRTAGMLALAGAGTAAICGWALAHSALTGDGVALSARDSAGHRFGIVLLIVALVLLVAGPGLARAADRVALAPLARRRIGIALLGVLALVPVAAVVALSESSRGLTGEVSHAWSSLTSVNAGVSNSAARLTQFGSSRPLYWSEGITVGDHAPFKGVGALGYATARTRYTTNAHVAAHAHSYVVQMYADLGLLGLAISLALLIAWALAAWRALGGRSAWRGLAAHLVAERSGLIALGLVVLGFGLVSAVDWTWYFPAVSLPALLAAGWLAGRGPLGQPTGLARPRPALLGRPLTLATGSLLLLLAVVGAWLIWQPLRSADDAAAAINAAARGDGASAFADARAAQAADPLALQPRFVLASLYQAARQPAVARSTLLGAVDLQPDNRDSWLQLGSYDLQAGRLRPAVRELQRAVALDPTIPATVDALAEAQAELKARG